MKKSLIAGAGVAALAMAALPFAGVFAETTVKDNITVSVSSACELADITPTGTSGTNANNYFGSGNPGGYVLINAGTSSQGTFTPGTATQVTIHCNNSTGYTLGTTFTDLTGPGTAITYSGTADTTGGSGTWTAFSDGTTRSAAIPASGITSASSTMTTSYTFAYSAGLDEDQASGNYTGSATYTLTANQ